MSTVLDSPLSADRRIVTFDQQLPDTDHAAIAAESSPAAIVLTNLAGHVLYANRAFLDLFDLPSSESLVDLDLRQVCGERLDLRFLPALAKSGEREQRCVCVLHDGQPSSFICAATRVTAESGYPKWLSISLTPGGEARSELASLGDSERRQLRLLRTLAECIDLPAFALDPQGRLLWFNTPLVGFLQPLGIEIAAGKSLRAIFHDSRLHNRLRRNLRHALRGEQRVEALLVSTGNGERRCDFAFHPVRDEAGDVTAVMSIITEIIGSRHVIP